MYFGGHVIEKHVLVVQMKLVQSDISLLLPQVRVNENPKIA